MTGLVSEIFDQLKLFLKSPNGVHNVGEERDKWIANPKANSRTDFDNFYRLGMVIAIAFKNLDCIELLLPSCFWRYMVYGKLDIEDIRGVNVNQLVCFEKMQKMADEDIEYLDEKFTTFLSDGQEFELVPYGRQEKLTMQNKSEYIRLSQLIHKEQLIKPFEMARRGFRDSTFNHRYVSYTPTEMEKRITGMDYVRHFV